MIKRYLIKVFNDTIYSKLPTKYYETNKIFYNHIHEIWSIDLADMIDYRTSNNKRFGYIFIIIDNFSRYSWCGPLKFRKSQTITQVISNIPSTSIPIPNKIESDRGKEY